MFKSAECEFHKKCKLTRECSGCGIPDAAREYDQEYLMKINYSTDPDRRGLAQTKETYGNLPNRAESLDWLPMEGDDEDDEHSEEA